MRVLLTGANGFIGAWAMRRLVACGHSVVALDTQSPGTLALNVFEAARSRGVPNVVLCELGGRLRSR
jgi:UDP-glucose 4-epimerase